MDKLDRVARLATSIIVGDPSQFADAHDKMTQEVVDNWEANVEQIVAYLDTKLLFGSLGSKHTGRFF